MGQNVVNLVWKDNCCLFHQIVVCVWFSYETIMYCITGTYVLFAAPPQITQPPKDQHQYQGGAVTFTCVADDATEYTWLKNDRVPETKRWKTNGNELQYKDLSVKDDKIQVTCRATNAAGESSEAHAQLSVLG